MSSSRSRPTNDVSSAGRLCSGVDHSSAGSCSRIRWCSSRKAGPGSMPQLVGQAATHGVEDARASAWRPPRYSATINWPTGRSRSGCSVTSTLQLGDGLRVASEREVGLDAVLDRGEAQS